MWVKSLIQVPGLRTARWGLHGVPECGMGETCSLCGGRGLSRESERRNESVLKTAELTMVDLSVMGPGTFQRVCVPFMDSPE